MAVLELSPCCGPEAGDRDARQPGIRRAAQFQFGAPFLGMKLVQLRASLPGALQGLIDVDFRGIEEAHRVGQFDALFGIDIQQPRQTVERGLRAGCAPRSGAASHSAAARSSAGCRCRCRRRSSADRPPDRRWPAPDRRATGPPRRRRRRAGCRGIATPPASRSPREPWSPGRASCRCPTGWRDNGATASDPARAH